MHDRWAVGLTRRGGLTFELWQQKGRRKAVLPSSIVRKTPSFPHGLAPRALAVCTMYEGPPTALQLRAVALARTTEHARMYHPKTYTDMYGRSMVTS